MSSELFCGERKVRSRSPETCSFGRGREEKVTIGQVVNDDYREKATMRMKTRMEGRTKVWTTGQSDGWMDGRTQTVF